MVMEVRVAWGMDVECSDSSYFRSREVGRWRRSSRPTSCERCLGALASFSLACDGRNTAFKKMVEASPRDNVENNPPGFDKAHLSQDFRAFTNILTSLQVGDGPNALSNITINS